MTPDFISRLIGMIVFTVIGARLGVDLASFLNLDVPSRGLIFGLVGMLFGIVMTPFLTVRPVRFVRRAINEVPIERLLMSIVGAVVGLTLALLVAYPLSLLGGTLGNVLPSFVSVVGAYLGMATFGIRSREILDAASERVGVRGQRSGVASSRKLILDTSVLIDGRIADVAETGFLGGTLIVPRFVMNELHRVADSSDVLRRNRGRRGLAVLNKIQRSDTIPVRIVDEDFEGIVEVDDKLVALALQLSAAIMTNDYNLGQVAEAQGITVLNINQLSNAVRAIYIPGEVFPIRVIQEGRDPNQGVGYLDDGTMVVVENGKNYMDRTIRVLVTKLINRDTGRMIFAIPENDPNRPTSFENVSVT
jgi:uncharacterized protein YacL